MGKFVRCVLSLYVLGVYGLFVSIVFVSTAHADYTQGCDDPAYHLYIENRFAHLARINQRTYNATLREYEDNLSNSDNAYLIINSLSRHLRVSAQIDPIEVVQIKIDLLQGHIDELSLDQQIAAFVFDNFSDENHSVSLARAWINYRQGNTDTAFAHLLNAVDLDKGSAVLKSFGPDFDFIRHVYARGHVQVVLDYLTASEAFWTGKKPNNLRYIWREMIKADCKIQFQSYDTTKALELGLAVLDVKKDYGLN